MLSTFEMYDQSARKPTYIYTIKPVLRGHLYDKDKVTL